MRRSVLWIVVVFGSLMPLRSVSAEAAEPAGPRHDTTVARLERELQRHPDDPALQYNHGTLLYHDEAYEQAADSLRKALSASRAGLQGRAAYNLGNTYYRLGQAKEAAATGEALALYRQALDGYRLAMKQDPHDHDARYNYELVQKRMTALEAQHAKAQETKTHQEKAEHQEASAAPQQATGAPPQAEEPPAASGAAAQQQEEQPQAERQREAPRTAEHAEETGTDQKADASASNKEAFDEKALSKQQALWILDSVKHEEQGALRTEGRASEAPVAHDW